jgi:hypothetical protein
MKKILLFIGLLFLVLPSFTYALGVMPAGRLFEYEPGKTHSFDLNIINNDAREMSVSVYVHGEFSEYVVVQDPILQFSPADKEKKTRVTFKIPDGLEPGTQNINIVVLERPGLSRTSDGNMITTTASVISQIRINVQHPGLYAKAVMKPLSTKVGERIPFQVSILNLGEQDISTAYADIEIFSPTNERLASFSTDSASISPRQEGKVTGYWVGSENPGKYFARGIVHYDGKSVFVEEVFELGNKNVEMTNLRVESYRYGGVAKLLFRLRNTWNQGIDSTHARFEVIDSNRNVVRDFQSITISLEPYASKELEVFWDTSGIEPGNYDLNIRLFFDGSSSTIVQPVYLDLNELRLRDGPLSGLVTGTEDSGSGYMLILLVIGVLIALNIALFLFVKRAIKKK